MKLYYKFRNSSLDTSPLGLYAGPDHSDSVYTPSGARLLAWLTSDIKVHFCQIDSLGDKVFVVDPNATPGDCVHPVAKDVPEFIGLLIACKDTSVMAAAHSCSKLLFQKRIDSIKPSMKARSVLRALENTYLPPVISDPYGVMEALRRDFDYRTLPLHPDYFEWCPIRPGTPKWEVCFGIGFGDYCQKGMTAKELAVNRRFTWQSDAWSVPGIYLCESGIIVDYCLEVSADRVLSFMSKWDGRNEAAMSVEDKMFRQLENPLDIDCVGTLTVNDREFRCKHAFSVLWNPWTDNTWQARRTLEHYGLDQNKGYLFRRECYPRKGKFPPIRTMQLTLSAAPVSVPGQRFVAPEPGEHLIFTHPDTGKKHTLTVASQTREALNPNFLSNHPCCYTKLEYELEPPIEKPWFQIADSDPGDLWEGSPDAPSAVFLKNEEKLSNVALSSLRYTPAEQINWRMIFRQKLQPDVRVRLLP